MVASEARTGRLRQRYDVEGCRLVAGCVPYRYTGESDEILEVLMVTPHKGDGLLFPKGGWENDEKIEDAACREAYEEAGVKGDLKDELGSWDFISRRHLDEHSSGGFRRKSHMYALLVTEYLDSWPEKDVRQRRWVTVPEAMGLLRHGWMQEALQEFDRLYRKLPSPLSEPVDGSDSSVSQSQSSDEDLSEQSLFDDDIRSFETDESFIQKACCSNSFFPPSSLTLLPFQYNEES